MAQDGAHTLKRVPRVRACVVALLGRLLVIRVSTFSWDSGFNRVNRVLKVVFRYSPVRSSLLMKAMRGTLYRRICLSTVRDCDCTPATPMHNVLSLHQHSLHQHKHMCTTQSAITRNHTHQIASKDKELPHSTSTAPSSTRRARSTSMVKST